MSATPMNLNACALDSFQWVGADVGVQELPVEGVAFRESLEVASHRFRMLRKVFNLELSFGVLSMAAAGTEAVGVEAPDLSADGALDED